MRTSSIKKFINHVPFNLGKGVLILYELIANKIKGIPGLKYIEYCRKFDTVVVLGNGPSLSFDLEDIQRIGDADFFCVNHFADSKIFSTIRPRFYLFTDPYFYTPDAHIDFLKKRCVTFERLNKIVEWKMMLFIPSRGDLSVVEGAIKNSNIEIIRYNCIPFIHPKDDWLSMKLMATGFFGPPGNNVLIYAIYISIWASYRNIYIYGADMDYYKYVVTNENNDLVYAPKHFTGSSNPDVLRRPPFKSQKYKVSGYFYTTFTVFKAHDILRKLADRLGTNIINRSSRSMIDSYDRF
jgi:hypothetical protein